MPTELIGVATDILASPGTYFVFKFRSVCQMIKSHFLNLYKNRVVCGRGEEWHKMLTYVYVLSDKITRKLRFTIQREWYFAQNRRWAIICANGGLVYQHIYVSPACDELRLIIAILDTSGTISGYVCPLTHWGRDKIAAIFQTIFSNTFFWMNMYEFRLIFHWSLYLRVH